mgnify:CR=1 FL=1
MDSQQIELSDTQVLAQLAWLPPAGESARVNAALNAQILEDERVAS